MSDPGLFSGIYHGIRDRADLLDRVLVRLKAGTSTPADDERQRLAAWLASLTEAPTMDAFARTLRVLLRGQRAAAEEGWAEVGQALRAGEVGTEVVARLEELARALEREEAAALARLRGEA